MLTWTRNVQETFNVVFSAFDVVSVLSFIKNLITLFTFDLHFISAFHLLCLSRGNKSWYHVTKGAGLPTYLPSHLTFGLTK